MDYDMYGYVMTCAQMCVYVQIYIYIMFDSTEYDWMTFFLVIISL